MARRLMLDTGVIVGLQRHQLRPADAYEPGDQLTISSITAAELLVGAELAPPHLVQQTRVVVQETLDTIEVLDHDLAVARVHALLLAHATREGKPRGALDLAIAATAAAHRCVLVTTDAKANFGDLPGLDVVVVGNGSGQD